MPPLRRHLRLPFSVGMFRNYVITMSKNATQRALRRIHPISCAGDWFFGWEMSTTNKKEEKCRESEKKISSPDPTFRGVVKRECARLFFAVPLATTSSLPSPFNTSSGALHPPDCPIKRKAQLQFVAKMKSFPIQTRFLVKTAAVEGSSSS